MKTWGSRIKWACTAIALSIALLCCAVFSSVSFDYGKKVSAENTVEQSDSSDSSETNDNVENTENTENSVHNDNSAVQSVTYAPQATELVTYYEITGTNQAATWNAAMEMSVNNAVQVTVALMADWTASGGVFGSGTGFSSNGGLLIPANADIILDLNNHTINRGLTEKIKEGCVIKGLNCKLTLNDGSAQGNGKITGGNNSVSIHATDVSAGGIGLSDSEFIMNGGHISGNVGYTGGGFYARRGVCHFYGGYSENNTASYGAGAYFHDQAVATFYDGFTIRNNTSSSSGGACEFFNGNTITINGGLFTGNKAGGDAGAFYVTSGSTFTMNGGTVTNNTSGTSESGAGFGGGIFPRDYGSKFSISGGEIYDNYKVKADGTKILQNVYIPSADLKIVVTGRLQNTKKIGVTLATSISGGFTLGYSNFNTLSPRQFFFDEVNGKEVILNSDGEAEFGTAAATIPTVTLTWQYSTDYGANWANVGATSVAYSGSTYLFRAMNGTSSVALALSRYTDINGNSSNITTVKNTGTYVYMVNNSAGTYSNPSFTFTITQVTVSITWHTQTQLTYNGSPQRPTADMGNVLAADRNSVVFVYDNGLESSAVNVGNYSTSITGLSGS